MSTIVVIADAETICATVSGELDFEAARNLLLSVRKRWSPDIRNLTVGLDRVTHTSSCAIGAMVLLAELASDAFHLRIERCPREIEELFTSELLEHHFPGAVLAECRDLLRNAPPMWPVAEAAPVCLA